MYSKARVKAIAAAVSCCVAMRTFILVAGAGPAIHEAEPQIRTQAFISGNSSWLPGTNLGHAESKHSPRISWREIRPTRAAAPRTHVPSPLAGEDGERGATATREPGEELRSRIQTRCLRHTRTPHPPSLRYHSARAPSPARGEGKRVARIESSEMRGHHGYPGQAPRHDESKHSTPDFAPRNPGYACYACFRRKFVKQLETATNESRMSSSCRLINPSLQI